MASPTQPLADCGRGFMSGEQVLALVGLLGILLIIAFVGGYVTSWRRARDRDGGTPRTFAPRSGVAGRLPAGVNEYGEIE